MERTLGLIKPDAVAAHHLGHILSLVEESGLHLAALRVVRLGRAQADAFYAVHRAKPFFAELLDYITGGPLVALALEGDDAIVRWRTLLGATDPAKAGPDTIRGRYGRSLTFNAAHGSDAPETAVRELAFFFSDLDLVAAKE